MKKILVLMITASMLFHLFTSTAYAKSSVTELEAPTNLTAELKYREEDGSPYFELRLTHAKSNNNSSRGSRLWHGNKGSCNFDVNTYF